MRLPDLGQGLSLHISLSSEAEAVATRYRPSNNEQEIDMSHLKKHLIHALFVLAMALAVRASDLVISGIALAGVIVLTLVALELGLWIIDRRAQRAAI